MKNISLLYFFLILAAMVLYGWFDPDLYPFPKCPLRSFTGWLCPGCGSQRAMHHALHGQWVKSFQLNPLFLPVILYGLSGWLISILDQKRWPEIRMKWFGPTAAWIALGIIVIFWIGRNLI